MTFICRLRLAWQIVKGTATIEKVSLLPPYQVRYRLGRMYGVAFGEEIGSFYEAEYNRCVETSQDVVADEAEWSKERKNKIENAYGDNVEEGDLQ